PKGRWFKSSPRNQKFLYFFYMQRPLDTEWPFLSWVLGVCGEESRLFHSRKVLQLPVISIAWGTVTCGNSAQRSRPRGSRPLETLAASIHRSRADLAQSGRETVQIYPPLPIRGR